MEQISVTDAAQRKGCSGQAVRDAIKKGLLDAIVIGRTYVVMTTRKFETWQPVSIKQQAGRARWGKPKKKRKA
jgi:hypothetical protein